MISEDRLRLKHYRWSGTVHLDNVEEIGEAVGWLLAGRRFTVVRVETFHGQASTVEVLPSQELSPKGVESEEGPSSIGFRINGRDRSWAFHTMVDGPCPGESERGHDPSYNRPYGSFVRREGPSFRWTGRNSSGTIVTYVFAVEYDQKMELVWDVMDA
jgi:hypothetical protein